MGNIKKTIMQRLVVFSLTKNNHLDGINERNFRGRNFHIRDFWVRDFRGRNFRGRNFRGRDFRRRDFRHSDAFVCFRGHSLQ